MWPASLKYPDGLAVDCEPPMSHKASKFKVISWKAGGIFGGSISILEKISPGVALSGGHLKKYQGMVWYQSSKHLGFVDWMIGRLSRVHQSGEVRGGLPWSIPWNLKINFRSIRPYKLISLESWFVCNGFQCMIYIDIWWCRYMHLQIGVCVCIEDIYINIYIYAHPVFCLPYLLGLLYNLKLLRDFKSSTPRGKLFLYKFFGASKCDWLQVRRKGFRKRTCIVSCFGFFVSLPQQDMFCPVVERGRACKICIDLVSIVLKCLTSAALASPFLKQGGRAPTLPVLAAARKRVRHVPRVRCLK